MSSSKYIKLDRCIATSDRCLRVMSSSKYIKQVRFNAQNVEV